MTEKIWLIYVPNLQFPHNTSSPVVLPFEPAFKTTALHTLLPPVIPQTGLQHICTCWGSHFCTTLFLCNDLLSSKNWKPAMGFPVHSTENITWEEENTYWGLLSKHITSLSLISKAHAHLWHLPGSISCLGAPQLQLKWLRRWGQAENGNTCPQEPPVPLPQICTESSLEAKTGLPSALYLCRQLLAKTLSFS